MKYLFSIVCILCFLYSNAQHPNYWSLTEDDGLPSNVVYDMLQDSMGYIWIGTDKGLVRYGGQEIETFISATQKSLSITGLQEDRWGRIWGVNFSQQVFYVEDDTLHELELPARNKIQGHVKAELIGDMLYVYSYRQADRLDLETMEWEMDFYGSNWPSANGSERKLLYSIAGDGNSFGMSFSEVIHLVMDDGTPRELWVKKHSGYHRSCWFQEAQILVPNGFAPILEFRSNTGDTAAIPITHPAHSSSTRVLVCLEDGAGNLWLCTSEGARIIRSNETGFSDQLFFPEYQVSRVVQDREGNLWFGTLQHGIRVVPGHDVLVLDKENSNLSFTEVSSLGVEPDGSVLVGSFNGMVQRIRPNGTVDDPVDLHFRKEVNGFVMFQDQIWAFGEWLTSLQTGKVKGLGRPVSIKQVERIDARTLAIVSSEGFAITDFSGSEPQIPTGRVPYGSVDHHGTSFIAGTGVRRFQTSNVEGEFYLSSSNGLTFYTRNNKTELLTHNGTSIYSLDMTLDNNGVLWVSTVSKGILAFNGTELIKTIKPEILEDELQFSNIEVHNGLIWIVSNKGLFRIYPETLEHERFDVSDGLPTNSINDLKVHSGFVWLATMKGLVKLPTEHSSINRTAPKLAINSVQVNQKDVEEISNLRYDQNNITFQLSPISIRSRGEAKIRYRLQGLTDNWTEVPIAESEVRFLALAPGEYTFQAMVINEDGVESNTINQRLNIAPPFWQTWWFYLLIIFIVVLIISAVFSIRIREMRKRDAVQHDLRVSELTALKAQMNPHFVFNALNSIQDYILTNQTELANDYLGKFARLMRKTLDQSQQITVTLSEEVDLLKLYLELEAIRFEDEFEYRVSVDKNVNAEQLEIPSMIVQPFVENAIKHGLLHKKEDRKLLIQFKMTEDVLECRIEDNGIGLEASKKMNAKRNKLHRSFGTGAVKKRLALLNEERKEQISVKMTDVTDIKQGTSGTHVVLLIPILNEKENA